MNVQFNPPDKGIEIFIVSNGVHTDFVIPIDNEIINWRSYFRKEDFGVKMYNASHIAFGWGDQGFYLNTPEWKDLKTKTALIALFVPSKSAMHVTLWNQPKEDNLAKKVIVSHDQYRLITEYIRNSFLQDSAGGPIRIDHPGYGSYDLFYRSKLTFHLFRTCNVWTNTGLIRSGIRTSIWTPFDRPILFQLSRID
jgi:uncharacterized protein (TIGR02117 family)